MAKRKIGVSLLTMFALVLMFSISALAAGVTGLKANVENNTLRASWTALGDATQYTITITDIKTGSKLADAIVVTETSYTTAVDASKKYSVEVDSDSTANPDAVKIEVWSPASNAVQAKDGETKDKNNIGNANQTGTNADVEDGTKALGPDGVIKNPTDGSMVKNNGTTGTHRTHGEYQNNTNSCASCHQTHTGASKSLLFKDGVYNTCTACHDGTLGMYNVFEHSNAGTFGGTEAGNMSIHMADGSVQIKAAPGGNLSSNSGAWINEFNCASCHSPHGSYSDRLLHYSPNGMGTKAPAEGGIGAMGATVYNFANIPVAPATTAPKYIVVRGTGTELGLLAADIDGNDPATTKAMFVYEFKAGSYGAPNKYVKTNVPWLYGYAYASPNKNYFTRFYEEVTDVAGYDTVNKKVTDGPDGAINDYDKFYIVTETDGTKHYKFIVDNHDQDWNTDLKIKWGKGFIYAANSNTILDNAKTADVGRAYTVDLDLVEIAKFGDANGVPVYKSNIDPLYNGTKSGAGVQMSTYCASCHTDYLAHSGSETGTWNKAYRHSTDSDSYTCVRCHYAHGTDVAVMMDAEGRMIDEVMTDTGMTEAVATDYMLDQNPSSALKRYTNMSVCWGCHTDSKAEQLKNTSSYGDETAPGQVDPHGLVEQGEMPGEITDANGDKVIINGN